MNNACIIYWIGVVDNLVCFMGTVVGLAIAGVITLLVVFMVKSDIDWNGDDHDHEAEKQKLMKWIVVCAVTASVCGLAMIFIPTEKRMWAMWIADRLTYENMQSAVDYVVGVVKELR